jgi:predicted short-subunit dehydrogenase-like oxidoreductase (DUF2520 family)
MGEGVTAVELSELAARARRVLLAVSDDALRTVAEILSRGATPGGIALHTSGAREVDEIEPLRAVGFSCGTIHPLQTLSSALQGAQALRGAWFAISGDGPALEWARRIARLLEGGCLEIAPGRRPLYHAAAVMASNYMAALADAAQQLMSTATGSEPGVALQALAPIARAALDNALQAGPAAALTGPIERGDAETIAMHLTALSEAPEQIRGLYIAAGLQTLALARRKGLSPGAAFEIEALLKQ